MEIAAYGLVLALLVHFSGFMYWAGKISKAIESHSGRLDELEEWRLRHIERKS